ncbi:discoidin domain-containing protein [Lentzea flaviverrucosa]|uniref:Glycosyl hydrolases family 2, TIM barrel domain n=1 Tax=Lentzea flaviverrucosa TaxID=200379 RepID=A0A1H9D1R6_9PSEU|nr:discoidin domain-containing protein [Lentzea flaviverrucosa]RDI24717.1 glycosyl hydrolase family 2 [Lentzea flaviverrucosa]SEQ07331.1 Glycosyl hydrolases family 2, TIM barrel domain [Lentzea flaviverrucosa]
MARVRSICTVVAVLLGFAVVPAQAAPTLLSQGKPAVASSTENGGTPASAAVDGDAGTRWSSEWSAPQWLRVDLGASSALSRVELDWEGAYATAFEIQVSADGDAWQPVRSVTGATGGRQGYDVTGTGRYVRVHATQRANGYGVSLWEFRVFGTQGGAVPGSGVHVTGSQGDWQLTVDGQPWVVKGLTWGPPAADAARYMPELRSMGVNTLRTWGTDASTRPLLDAAASHGLRVINGFWLQPGGGPGSGGCVNYVTDAQYKADVLGQIRQWVTTYKDHPGVLMWNVGNESILGLQNCYSGAELENQRVAYARYLNEAARAIHAIDTGHPVTNTDAWTGAWAYLKAHTPDLDLYSVNSYGNVCQVRQDWISGGHTKPYILTEAGPAGEWEVPDDANGVPAEPTDVQKRDGYTQAWNCIVGHTGVSFGGTLFHYGTEYDFGAVWFNLTPAGKKRLSFYAVQRAFGGATPANTPPVISAMTVPQTVAAGAPLTIDVAAADPNGDAIAWSAAFNSKYIDNSGALAATPVQVNGNRLTVTAPDRLGVWKVYVMAEDGRGNIGIETRSVRVVAPQPSGVNVAQGKATTASSYQQVGDGAPFPPSNAVDGNGSSRWATDWADPQWLRVDLGAVTTFQHVQLVWEGAFGRAYEIQVSDDGNGWRTVHGTTTGNGGVDSIDVTATARYVRLHATQRGTGFGYSLYEFGVYRR